MRKLQLSLLSLALISLLVTPQAYADKPFYFELEYEQQNIQLQDQSHLDIYSIGVRYRERWSPHIALEMKLGRLAIDHENDPTTLDYNQNGYYAGIGINSSTDEKYRLRAGLELSYSYFHSNDNLEENHLEINGHQAKSRLWLTLRLSTQFRLFTCATALKLDGKQHLNNGNPARTDLKNQDITGICGGLIIETTDHGFAGIEANGGGTQGGRIYFGRRF